MTYAVRSSLVSPSQTLCYFAFATMLKCGTVTSKYQSINNRYACSICSSCHQCLLCNDSLHVHTERKHLGKSPTSILKMIATLLTWALLWYMRLNLNGLPNTPDADKIIWFIWKHYLTLVVNSNILYFEFLALNAVWLFIHPDVSRALYQNYI